ncbi:hypothetical protein FALBO_10662 [Fusarium albosuccineum]|uniref:Uncharacterized protein n=1 Tax=Fusarium albosuccineum TaxID=1237068 RepID=A0A8H4L7E3_9HYPO|nr:hypothetical protein FALBO_10662 [Fusarium albosuccineum]
MSSSGQNKQRQDKENAEAILPTLQSMIKDMEELSAQTAALIERKKQDLWDVDNNACQELLNLEKDNEKLQQDISKLKEDVQAKKDKYGL